MSQHSQCVHIYYAERVVEHLLRDLSLKDICHYFWLEAWDLWVEKRKTVSDPAWDSGALLYNYHVNPDDSLWSLQTRGRRLRQAGLGMDLSQCSVGHWIC